MTGNYATTRAFGQSNVNVTSVAVGTGAWGLSSAIHDTVVKQRAAIETALAAFDGPFNVLDTSNNYGDGESERRIGQAIREHGGLPAGFVLQTKLDRDANSNEFSGARMWQSLEESLSRLGVDRVEMLYLHDPENASFDTLTETGGAVEAIVEMKRQGLASAIGVAGGPVTLLGRLLELDTFDAVLTHTDSPWWIAQPTISLIWRASEDSESRTQPYTEGFARAVAEAIKSVPILAGARRPARCRRRDGSGVRAVRCANRGGRLAVLDEGCANPHHDLWQLSPAQIKSTSEY
ncbi:MAG: aldo/keto reductase [Galbitalea sp.]